MNLHRPATLALLAASLALGYLASVGATGRAPSDSCTVPGTHDTIQEAVDDAACDSVGLTSEDYFESVAISRSLTLTGAPSTIHGELEIAGTGTDVEVDGIEIAEAPLFYDGFESGNTSAWSQTVP